MFHEKWTGGFLGLEIAIRNESEIRFVTRKENLEIWFIIIWTAQTFFMILNQEEKPIDPERPDMDWLVGRSVLRNLVMPIQTANYQRSPTISNHSRM